MRIFFKQRIPSHNIEVQLDAPFKKIYMSTID